MCNVVSPAEPLRPPAPRLDPAIRCGDSRTVAVRYATYLILTVITKIKICGTIVRSTNKIERFILYISLDTL